MARGFIAGCTLACFTVGLAFSRASGAEQGSNPDAALARAERVAAGTAYRAAPGCPSQAEWDAGLHARLPPELRGHPLVERLKVEVRRSGAVERASALYAGVLYSAVDTASDDARRVQGADCADVVAALTLIAALDIERAARESTSEAAPRPDPWGFSAGDAVALAEAQDAPRTSAEAHPSRVALGPALFAMYGGALSGLALGAGAVVRWTDTPLEPWLLAGVYRASHAEPLGAGAGSAQFEQLALHVAGCAGRLAHAGGLALRPCIDVDVGRVTGEGVGIRAGRSRAAPWLSAGAELRLAWSPVHALAVHGMLGLVVPLVHPRFYVLPGVTALEVAPVGLRAGAGSSAAF